MDNLTYGYDSGNKLLSVTDPVTTPTLMKGEFKDGNKTGNDYNYDDNGNLIQDLNKGITANGITYNHLNLPSSITTTSGNISYIYDASGTKLQKTVTEGSSVTSITDYSGNYIYENGDLQFFSHPEGYVNAEGSGYKYVFQYKDHLGNIRLSYTDDPSNPGAPTIIEENNYYPFGLKHKGYNHGTSSLGNSVAQRWKYSGKEYDESLDINTYDFGARNYNPAIGRWMNIDPMADLMKRVTPYNYTFNNPIKFIDPNGMAPIDPPGSGTDNDPYQLEPITVSANSKSGSRGWSSESLTAFSGSLDQYKRQYKFTGDYENVKEQYSNKYGNSYESPKYNSMEGVDFNSFKANWNMGYLGWEDGSIGVFLMDVTTYSIGGTLLSTTLLPYVISGGGLQSALGKSTISGIVQYGINDRVNIVSAFSDGFLMPGVGDALGAGFEVNVNSNLNIKSRSILGSKSSSSVIWEAGVGTIFGVKMEGLNNIINKSEASNFAKGLGEGMFETGTKSASYGIQTQIK